MIERVLATVYVKIYEKQGKLFGVISTIIVVIIFSFILFKILVVIKFNVWPLHLYYNTNGYRHIWASNGLSNTNNEI